MMMTSPLNRRRRRAAIVISSLLTTCCCSEFSTAFTPINSSSLSTAADVAPTDFSCATTSNLSNHHRHLTSNRSATTTTHLHLFKKKNSPLEDEPWKKDDSYWDQLQAASKDPEQFEKFIEETMAKKKKKSNSSSSSSSSTSSSSLAAAYSTNNQEETTTPKKKSAYVPIEEWDATNKDNMSKEERLQWECQQSGNRYRQNEILMHNLKSF